MYTGYKTLPDMALAHVHTLEPCVGKPSPMLVGKMSWCSPTGTCLVKFSPHRSISHEKFTLEPQRFRRQSRNHILGKSSPPDANDRDRGTHYQHVPGSRSYERYWAFFLKTYVLLMLSRRKKKIPRWQMVHSA